MFLSHKIHQDSPRPIFGGLKSRKELKLPVRKKEAEFDLMANARRLRKREETTKNTKKNNNSIITVLVNILFYYQDVHVLINRFVFKMLNKCY